MFLGKIKALNAVTTSTSDLDGEQPRARRKAEGREQCWQQPRPPRLNASGGARAHRKVHWAEAGLAPLKFRLRRAKAYNIFTL